MVIKCGACGKDIGIEGDLSNGQCVVCPICGEQTQFDKPTRIEIPLGATRRVDYRQDFAETEEEETLQNAEEASKRKPKLRVMRNPDHSTNDTNPSDTHRVHMVEERLRTAEEIKHKAWRRKFLGDIFSVIVLLAIPIVGWFVYSEWTEHARRVAYEEEQRAAEEQAKAEKAEQERRTRAAQEAHERRVQRDKEMQDRENRIAEERAAQMRLREQERTRLEAERKLLVEQYRVFSAALSENEFDLFNKNVTNGLEEVCGELCYCFPTETHDIPFYWVKYSTNGVDFVREIRADGGAIDTDYSLLQAKISNQDYIVAREDKVFFHSRKKNKRTGVLPKDKAIDPAEVFFGDMSGTLERLKAKYDELTFDIVFIPAGAKKEIDCENVEFGCRYSIDNVREALEKAFPPSRTFVGSTPKVKKFNRTVKLWNGANIKKGMYGITYVPRERPSYHPGGRWINHKGNTTTWRTSGSRGSYVIRNGNGNITWRTSTRGNNYNYHDEVSRWEALYNQAIREDREEAEYYENARRRQKDRIANAQSADEKAWISKIDKIFSEGTLYYRIKKAKRKN